MQRISLRQLSMFFLIAAGPWYSACEGQVHDLDGSENQTRHYVRTAEFLMDQEHFYWIEQYQRTWLGFEHVLMTCDKKDCGATRKQLTSMTTSYSPSTPLDCER